MKVLALSILVAVSLSSCGLLKPAGTSNSNNLKTVPFIPPVKVVGDSTQYMK